MLTDYYNTLIFVNTSDSEAHVMTKATLNFTQVDFFNQSSDFIDIHFLTDSYVKNKTGESGVFDYPLKGLAIKSEMRSSLKINFQFLDSEISARTYFQTIQTQNPNYMRIYYCPQWDYTSTLEIPCTSNWTRLNTNIVLGSGTTSNPHSATATLNTAINSSAAFILTSIEPGTPELSTTNTSITMNANHNTTNNLSLNIISSGTSEVQGISANCYSGNACTSFNFSQTTLNSLPSEQTVNLNMTFAIDPHTPNATYTGTIRITSNAQNLDIPLTITILPDTRYSIQLSNNYTQTGSNNNGTMGVLTINNNGNTILPFTLAMNNSYINVDNPSFSLSPNEQINKTIRFSAPSKERQYTTNLTITQGINQTSYVLTTNVTHEVNIISLSQNISLSQGIPLTITANATYQQIPYNITNWSVYVGQTLCDLISVSANQITCTLPQASGSINQTLKIIGFYNNSNATAFAQITYIDTIAPVLINYTNQTEYNQTTIIEANFYDDSTLAIDSTAEMIGPDGQIQNTTILLDDKKLTLVANLTQIGEYNITYTIYDISRETLIVTKTFELFEYTRFSGTVNNAQGEGVAVNFTFYRPGTQEIAAQIISNNGTYNLDDIHKKTYDLEINTLKMTLIIYNLSVNNTIDPIDIDTLVLSSVEPVNPTGEVNDLYGVAVRSNFTNITGTLTLRIEATTAGEKGSISSSSSVRMYKCANFTFATQTCNPDTAAADLVPNQNTTSLNQYIYVTAPISSFSAYFLTELRTLGTTAPTTQVTGLGASAGASAGGGMMSGPQINASTLNATLEEKLRGLKKSENILSVDTTEIQRDMMVGESARLVLKLTNEMNSTLNLNVTVSNEIEKFITFQNPNTQLQPGEKIEINYNITISANETPNVYRGQLILRDKANAFERIIPVTLRITQPKEKQLTVDLKPLASVITPGKTLKIDLNLYNPLEEPIQGILKIQFIQADIEKELFNQTIAYNISTFWSDQIQFNISPKTKLGNYIIKATTEYEYKNNKYQVETFENIIVEEPLLKRKLLGFSLGQILFVLILAFGIGYGIYKTNKYFESKKRYQLQIDHHELPKQGPRSVFVGNLAESRLRAFFELEKLTTHTIVAGSTGGGKSISAQVLAEEALEKGISVIIFDPTAQWSGFLRPLEDKKMLAMYSKFSMSQSDAKAYNGNIHQIDNARQKINLTKYMKGGEIHIFTINKLGPEEIDIFVANTVHELFSSNLEESPELKTLIIYDEVHRLLPKFGGTGQGYVQIERACREFRKWGIGLILISQVLTDFIGEIKANINTEIQVRTKDEGDLERLKTKYGDAVVKGVLRANIGTGMIGNAAYNRGRPYFIEFRPIKHSVRRLSDGDLEKYHKFNTQIEDLEYAIEGLEKEKIDVFDYKLELNLALKRLKAGSFNMVKIYLDSLEQRVKKSWEKLGKEPPKREIVLVDATSINASVEKAKKEREKILAKEKSENPEVIKTDDAAKTDPSQKTQEPSEQKEENKKTEPPTTDKTIPAQNNPKPETIQPKKTENPSPQQEESGMEEIHIEDDNEAKEEKSENKTAKKEKKPTPKEIKQAKEKAKKEAEESKKREKKAAAEAKKAAIQAKLQEKKAAEEAKKQAEKAKKEALQAKKNEPKNILPPKTQLPIKNKTEILTKPKTPIPPKPAGPTIEEKEIENLKKEYQDTGEKIVELRKLGKNVTLEEAMLKPIMPDIDYQSISYSESAVKKIRDKLQKINQELENLKK